MNNVLRKQCTQYQISGDALTKQWNTVNINFFILKFNCNKNCIEK